MSPLKQVWATRFPHDFDAQPRAMLELVNLNFRVKDFENSGFPGDFEVRQLGLAVSGVRGTLGFGISVVQGFSM